MTQDLLYRGGFWMEGRVDNYNDMEEIRRMLRQLTECVARIEARTQIGKSSDGERCVNPYLNRVARIDTLSRGSLDGEYEGDSPFHYCASLCESSEEGHDYSHCVFEGRFQLYAKRSRTNMKQLKILLGFSSIKGLNSRTNSFQPGESDAGA
ncbi:unnamed protein product [Prunus armeniaca]